MPEPSEPPVSILRAAGRRVSPQSGSATITRTAVGGQAPASRTPPREQPEQADRTDRAASKAIGPQVYSMDEHGRRPARTFANTLPNHP